LYRRKEKKKKKKKGWRKGLTGLKRNTRRACPEEKRKIACTPRISTGGKKGKKRGRVARSRRPVGIRIRIPSFGKEKRGLFLRDLWEEKKREDPSFVPRKKKGMRALRKKEKIEWKVYNGGKKKKSAAIAYSFWMKKKGKMVQTTCREE